MNDTEISAQSSSKSSDFARKLLFFSLEDWDKVWRRNQFFCRDLMARNPKLQILWVAPPYDFSHDPTHVDSRVLRLSQDMQFPQMKVFKPLKILPNVVGKQINSFAMRLQIEQVLKRLSWTNFDVWVNDQKARNYLPSFGTKKLIYDVTDDWTQFDQPPRVKSAVIADDAWMLANADETVVCSEWLYKKNSSLENRLHLIPNGVDAQRYSPAQLLSLQPPGTMTSLAKKVAGYVGTLHAERLDLNLISNVAELLPSVTFAFVGPNCLTKEQTDALLEHSNVLLLGAVDYKDLPSYMKALDVCMTPHKVSSFTESLDPLKLYEYMSTGKPIVSTPCSGFRDLPDLVYIGATAESFADAIAAALNESGMRSQQRIDWSLKQTWDQRVDKVVEVLGW